MRYFDKLAEFERDGFTVIVDKTWEDLSPRDLFEEGDVGEILRKIDNGTYDWFMLRVRVFVEGLELARWYAGGCCYEDAKEVLTDGLAEDLIHEALACAKKDVYRLSKKFAELSEMVDNR
jgi:hypothetical protein